MSQDEKSGIAIEGDASGAARELARLLAPFPGTWHPAVLSPELLVLERAQGQKGGARSVLCGPVTGGGHLLDVIGCVSTSRWSGRLTVTSHTVVRCLYFVQGALRMATSTESADRLGELMHRLGRISRDQLDQAVREMRPGRRIGEILVETGAATTHGVFGMLHLQVEELFYATIGVTDGFFYFQDGVSLDGLPAYISLDTNNLLMEGVRRIDELLYFRKLIPGMRLVLSHKLRSVPPGPRDEKTTRFLALCDGKRTLADVACEMGIGEYEATKMAHESLTKGAADVIPTESAGQQSVRFVVDRFNDMISVVNQALHIEGDRERFLADVRSYPRQGGEFEDFISLLVPDETGHLDHENVATVLWQMRVADRMSYLVQVLTQYMFFILFLADNHLSRERHAEVSAEVHTMLQKIGA